MARLLWALLAGAVLVCAWPNRASAGGLFYAGSGTKALGRGAALHVGADNGLALLYNPAKLADLPGTQVLTDFNLAIMNACADLAANRAQSDNLDEGTYLDDYDAAAGKNGLPDITRFGAVPNGNPDEKRRSWAGSQLPEVCAEQDYLPIPNMVLSHNFVNRYNRRRGLRGLTVAFGMVVPGAVAGPSWGRPDGTMVAGGARPDVQCNEGADACAERDASGVPQRFCDPETDYFGHTPADNDALSALQDAGRSQYGGGFNDTGCPEGLPYYCDPNKYDCDLLPTPTRYMMVEQAPIAVPLTIGILVIVLGLGWNGLRAALLRLVPVRSWFRPVES